VKGRPVETYIYRKIVESGNVDFSGFQLVSVSPVQKKIRFTKISKPLQFSNIQPHYFSGNTLPDAATIPWTKNTLILIPESLTYPIIDFILWDHSNKILVAVQVALNDPLSGHKNKVIAKKIVTNLIDWANATKVYFLWLSTNSSVNDLWDGQYVLAISQLDQNFPELRNLQL